MKNLTSLLILLLISSQVLKAGEIEIRPDGKNELTMLESSWQKVVVRLSTAEIRTLQVQNGDNSFTRLIIPAASKTNEVGSPELPVNREFIEVPLNAAVRIEILRSSYQEFDLSSLGFPAPVMPAQAPAPKTGEDIPFVYDRNAYQVNSFTPDGLASFEMLGMMRSYRIGRLDLFPVRYNPVTHTLRVYDVIEVAVCFDHADISATIDLKQKYENFYYSTVGKNILNYQPASRDTVASYPLTYVIVSDPMFEAQLQPFIEWKTIQGFKVIEAYTSDPQVGSTTNTIKNYIKNLYDNPGAGQQPPSFVLFVGDIQQIPTWNGTAGSHVTDLYYCEYNNDLFPEIYYGRFSAQNPTQLQPQIDKTIQYEKYTMPDPSFLNEVVMVAGMDASFGQDWANGQINYGTENYFNSSNGIVSHTYLYPESGSHDNDIIQDVSNGVSFGNYTAHCSESGWGDPSFTIGDIATLQNQDQYCLLIGNCCLSSKYDVGECFAEAMLRAQNKGAVAYIGASNNTYWDEDYYFGVGVGPITEDPPSYEETTLGNYDRAFHTHGEPWEDWYTAAHQHVYAGNLAVTLGSPGSATYYWEAYNTMGDPSLMAYYSEPSAMAVTYMPLMPLGTSSFEVTAAPYSYVAISVDGVLKGTALADGQGIAMVPLTNMTTPCMADIVVTAQNMQPFFGEVIVANPEGPFILLNNNETVELSGYVNNKIEPGEVIGINIELKNYGQSDGTDVVASLSTMDEYITISDGYESCSTVPAQSTLEFDNAFSIIIDKSIPDNHEVEFIVNIQDPARESWSSTMTILLTAPVLKLNSLVINDTEGGNGNGRLDPGENVELTATFSNAGHAIARNTVANLCAHSGFISIANPDHTIGNLGLFGVTPVVFNVSVDNKAPNGILVDFMVNLTADGYQLNENHPTKIGFICEDFESGDFDNFPWSQGGNMPWTIINQYPFEGFYSIRSGAITHSQTSEISLDYHVMQGDSITFYRKVSAATGDSLKFMIDGHVAGAWSGTTGGWKRASYYVNPGNHEFTWVYMKNSNGSGGTDAAWIDYIVLPPSQATTIYAGDDALNCAGEDFHCQGQATNYQSITWSTTGTGSFNNSSILSAIYTPSAEDLNNGSVGLSLSLIDVEGEAFADGLTLTFIDIPMQPAIPSGPDYILIDTTYTSDYTISPVEGALSYHWMISPSEAGILTGDGNTVTVVWERDYAGAAVISVSAINECGEGPASEGFGITVDNSAVGFYEPPAVPFVLSVYPNPATEMIQVTASGEEVSNLEIRLVDLIGNVVAPPRGYNPWRVPVGHLAPGLYILIVTSDNHQATRKIIVR